MKNFECRFCKNKFEQSELYSPEKCYDCRSKERLIDAIAPKLWKMSIKDLKNLAGINITESEIISDVPKNIKVINRNLTIWK